ncbi:FtsK/SpoIIIE domain-containing protein [Rothia sp. ZJ932]|uniref:FtsK/SpoIIIE domain-containing protein n=1 Tax=Rothia sp. ZJ932 TaxID=2810516 RepID=UPI001966FA0C|nr:FtsK/SpoIIIE domain-containing protein [Rothia sp. ZJ932]QRZ61009.1 hypothetical protein JR346_07015 [Rothia sp. ZJ932]
MATGNFSAHNRVMELLLLLEIDTHRPLRPVRVETTGGQIGADTLSQYLRGFLGFDCQWWVGQQSLESCVLGVQPLVTGAILRRSPQAISQQKMLSFVTVHGPESGRFWQLQRGSYSLGKFNTDICISDPALEPVHGVLTVAEEGISLHADNAVFDLAVGETFILGSSRCLMVDSPLPLPSQPAALGSQTVELDPPRSVVQLILMTILPIVLGVVIALVTGMWLFLLMSMASSLVMGSHLFLHQGSSAATRRKLREAAERDMASASVYPHVAHLVESGSLLPAAALVSPGIFGRSASLSGRYIEKYRVPFVDEVPLLLPVEPGVSIRCEVEPRLLNLLVLQLLRVAQVSVVLTQGVLRLNPQWRLLTVLPTVVVVDSSEGGEQYFSSHAAVVATEPEIVGCDLTGVTTFIVGSCEADADVVLQTCGRSGQLLASVSSSSCLQVPGLSTLPCTVAADGVDDSTFIQAVGNLLQQMHSPTSVASQSADAVHQFSGRFSELTEFGVEDVPLRWSQHLYAPDLMIMVGKGLPRLSVTEHGPHFLVGGTTGSGKSQFLRSMVLSLAAVYSPARCSFLFIDFKGGAGLGPLHQLPHSLGLLSDLDTASVRRALAFLKADLSARERLFQQLEVNSYRDYLRVCEKASEQPGFSEIFIVVDEFKMLVESMPEAMNDLMKVATIGRSLGVHLILATQRPQGAVSADIKANISTVFALRVASSQDSHNLLGSDDAADISPSCPGAGWARLSDGQLAPFRAPRLDAAPYTYSLKLRVHDLYSGLQYPQRGESADTEDALFAAIVGAYTPALEPAAYVPIAPALTCGTPTPHKDAYYLGRHENAVCGKQDELLWSSASQGSLALVGSAAERHRVIFSLLSQAAQRGIPRIVFTAEPTLYRTLSHDDFRGAADCVLGIQDIAFLQAVCEEITQVPRPVLLVVDGIDILLEHTLRKPQLELTLLQLVQDGHRTGIEVIVSASTKIRGKFSTAAHSTVVTAETMRNDLATTVLRSEIPPGTGQWRCEGTLTHSISAETATVAALLGSSQPLCMPLTDDFRQLPEQIDAAQLPQQVSEAPKQGLLVGFSRRQRPVTLTSGNRKILCIAGTKGSGKTTLLQQLPGLNPNESFTLIEGRQVPGVSALTSYLDALSDPAQRILLIDDLHSLDAASQEALRARCSHYRLVVLAFTPWKRWHASPLLSQLAGTTYGIVLQPRTAVDGEFFGLESLPLDTLTRGVCPPGRALLIDGLEATAFQVPGSSRS